MKLKKILDEEKKSFEVDKWAIPNIRKKVHKLVNDLENEIKKEKYDIDVFIGGSFSKNTLIIKDFFDIDIYLRFKLEYNNISYLLEKILKNMENKFDFNLEKIHGSRDYFRLKKENIIFEIIPVYKIKKPNEAKNVTDLSYFHVNYIKKKIKDNNLEKEILLAKKFFKAQKIYGAEGYIGGFSGYAIECLIIYYGSFENTLRKLVKIKDNIILDPQKWYKNNIEVELELNENKMDSPIILIDPTWKERNVLAALTKETFNKFQKITKRFLDFPSNKFFESLEIDVEKMKKLDGEFIDIKIKTDKQEGDIAGTKMKKFSKFLKNELEKYFDIIKNEFEYKGGKEANYYIVIKKRKEIIKKGPPLIMKKKVSEFKRKNNNVFEKKGIVYSKIDNNLSGKEFLENFIKKNKTKIKEMKIIEIQIKC